jgi:hypothetical protein
MSEASYNSNSHEGVHGEFKVFWSRYDETRSLKLHSGFPLVHPGWYWASTVEETDAVGPFETSQTAFEDLKSWIDETGWQA